MQNTKMILVVANDLEKTSPWSSPKRRGNSKVPSPRAPTKAGSGRLGCKVFTHWLRLNSCDLESYSHV